MKESPSMGLNKTGIQMSPLDIAAMQAAPASLSPKTPGDQSAVGAIRSAYITEADALGSVPVPATFTGAAVTGISMLTGNSPQILLDKLGERLAFERTGTRLYDALITKCEVMQDGATSMTVEDLLQIRKDEARHALIVADAIESLGGDPTAQTPSADLVGVESLGLVQVLSDPRTTLAQSLHAILTAEMSDQAGWEILVALAEDQKHASMSNEFSLALNQERIHLQQVQTWYQEATLGKSYSNGSNGSDIDTPAS
jgi:rubrerythrin